MSKIIFAESSWDKQTAERNSENAFWRCRET